MLLDLRLGSVHFATHASRRAATALQRMFCMKAST